MRTFAHWTPRYLWDRSIEKIYRATHPGLPWLSPAANEILQSCLRSTDRGLEFGSGGSTVWFSRRIGSLTSVEHNPEWYARVTRMLKEAGQNNVEYLLRPMEPENALETPAYVRAAESFADNSLDYVLIDGIYRDQAALAVLDKITPGGMLIIDNVHLYFPNHSRCPNSIPPQSQPVTPTWEKVAGILADWRCIWTGNGVSDTAIYFKPCA